MKTAQNRSGGQFRLANVTQCNPAGRDQSTSAEEEEWPKLTGLLKTMWIM